MLNNCTFQGRFAADPEMPDHTERPDSRQLSHGR